MFIQWVSVPSHNMNAATKVGGVQRIHWLYDVTTLVTGDDIHHDRTSCLKSLTAIQSSENEDDRIKHVYVFFGYYPSTHIHEKVSQLRDDSMAIPVQ